MSKIPQFYTYLILVPLCLIRYIDHSIKMNLFLQITVLK